MRVVALALLICGAISATVIPRLSFETLTDSSELIVSGRIARTWTAWDSEHKYIWTHYELTASAAFKGAPGGTVEFAEPGGSVDGRVMVIEGAVTYAPGDQIVVFLSRMPNRYLRTTGWAQGKYDLDSSSRLRANSPHLNYLDGISLSDFRQRIAARLRLTGQGRAQ